MKTPFLLCAFSFYSQVRPQIKSQLYVPCLALLINPS